MARQKKEEEVEIDGENPQVEQPEESRLNSDLQEIADSLGR